LLAGSAFALPAQADSAPKIVVAEPLSPVTAEHPDEIQPVEAQVVVVLVVDVEGKVESAIATETLPKDLPKGYRDAAIDAVRRTRFAPSTRDGRPVRSRVD
jgi:hypothetical protein